VDVPERDQGAAMTEPRTAEVKRGRVPKTDWEEVRRRQERTRDLIDRMWDAQRRLERAVERLTRKH
jgi:hypothetical protein